MMSLVDIVVAMVLFSQILDIFLLLASVFTGCLYPFNYYRIIRTVFSVTWSPQLHITTGLYWIIKACEFYVGLEHTIQGFIGGTSLGAQGVAVWRPVVFAGIVIIGSLPLLICYGAYRLFCQLFSQPSPSHIATNNPVAATVACSRDAVNVATQKSLVTVPDLPQSHASKVSIREVPSLPISHSIIPQGHSTIPISSASYNSFQTAPSRPHSPIDITLFSESSELIPPTATDYSAHYDANNGTPSISHTPDTAGHTFDPEDAMPMLYADLRAHGWLRNGSTQYEIRGKLGEGMFGRVMHAVEHKFHEPRELERSEPAPDRYVAIKVIHKEKQYRSSTGRQRLLNEQTIMKRLTLTGMPFITKLLASFEDDANIYFVMPWCPTSLSTLLRAQESALTTSEAKLLAAELILGLAYIHGENVMHRDIKPENILLDNNGHAVFADFGLSYNAGAVQDIEFEKVITTDACGTCNYQAPEQIVPEMEQVGYNCKADVWSLGVVLLQVFSGMDSHFFNGDTIFEDILSMDIPFDTMIKHPDACHLISQMLDRNPHTRPFLADLTTHPFFADLDWDLVREHGYTTTYSRPPIHLTNYHSKSIGFTDFHRGYDELCLRGNEVFDGFGWLVPNAAVLKSMEAEGPDDFLFDLTDPHWPQDEQASSQDQWNSTEQDGNGHWPADSTSEPQASSGPHTPSAQHATPLARYGEAPVGDSNSIEKIQDEDEVF